MFKSDEENEFEGVSLYILEFNPSVRNNFLICCYFSRTIVNGYKYVLVISQYEWVIQFQGEAEYEG